MSSVLPCVPCCTPSTQTVNIPGTSGQDGLPGANGINAYTATTVAFSVPNVGVQVGVSVANSSWMVAGQNLIVQGPANFLVVSTPTTSSATLQFLGYPGDVAPGTAIGVGSTVSPAGILGGGWNVIAQKLDQAVINSTTLTSSASMQFAMLAATNYRLRGTIFFDTTAAGGFKYAFVGPAAPTLVRCERLDNVSAGAAVGTAPVARAVDTATPGATTASDGGTTGGYIHFDMIFQNGVNPATFGFQFAQGSAQSDTGAIIRAGSYMEWSVN